MSDRGILGSLAMMVAMAAAGGANAQARIAVDIPAGELGRALIILSQQSREDIGIPDPTLPRRASPAVRGQMTVRQALDRLIAQIPAVATRVGARSWRVAGRPRPQSPQRQERLPPPIPTEPFPADILVTASKRDVPLADYPGTATVLDFEEIGYAGAPAGSEAIENRLSSLSSTHFGAGRDKVFIRGIADSGFTGPSQATTGQYLNDTRLTYNAPDPNLRLYDVARVKVMEGPQGALYGAGALGGVIRVVTARPRSDGWSARGSTGLALTRHGEPSMDVAGMVNVPLLTDVAALRLVGYRMRDGGYIDDPAGGRGDFNRVTTSGTRAGVRLAVRDWTVDVDAAWQEIVGPDSQWTNAGALARTGPPLGYRSDFLLGDITLSRTWGGIDLISTTSASHQYLIERYDATSGDEAPTTVRQIDRTTLLTNETRVSQRAVDGAGWIAGVSILHNHGVVDRLATDGNGGTTPHQYAVNDAWEETLFGEAGIRLPAGVVATIGARLTNARSDGSATAYIESSTIPIFGSPVSARGERAKFRIVPTAALSGHPTGGTLLFARLQQGFRPGGFGISDSRAREYDGDRITTGELGIRLGGPSRPFEVSATLSYSDWRHILAEVVTLSGDPITRNIGNGRIGSLEARGAWRPLSRLSIEGGLFVNRSRLHRPAVASVVVARGALPNVARLGMQASIAYEVPLSEDGTLLRLSGNGRYFGGSHIGAGPVLDAAQGDYVNGEFFATLTRGARSISLSVANPLDARGNRFALGTPYRIYASQATPLRPRTVRLGVDVRF